MTDQSNIKLNPTAGDIPGNKCNAGILKQVKRDIERTHDQNCIWGVCCGRSDHRGPLPHFRIFTHRRRIKLGEANSETVRREPEGSRNATGYSRSAPQKNQVAASRNEGPDAMNNQTGVTGSSRSLVPATTTDDTDKTVLKGDSGYSIPVLTTIPASVLRHNISDEELEMLSSSQTRRIENFMWSMVGVSFGAASAAFKNVNSAYFVDQPIPLNGGQLVEIILFIVPVFLALGAVYVCHGYTNEKNKLLIDIRSRQKM